MKISFAKDQWDSAAMQQAYTFRYTAAPDFTQNDDCISGGVNAAHPEGFDNISLLTRENYASAKATIRCAFEDLGCPEIIFVGQPELCDDGVTRYGACFEVVLYKNGVNVWRHYREDGRCFWHKRLGVQYPVAESEIHELSAEYKDNYLTIWIDGQKNILRVDDMFPRFHMGLTVCEGIARVYDMTVEGE